MERSQIRSGAMLTYTSIIVSLLVNLLYAPFMLSKLGPSQYGIYSLAYSITTYFSLLDGGFGNSITRFTSKYLAENDTKSMNMMLGMLRVIYSGIGVVTMIVGVILTLSSNVLFSQSLTANELVLLRVLLPISVFNAAISFPLSMYMSVISAHQRFVFINFIRLIHVVVHPLLMVAVLLANNGAIEMLIATTVLGLARNACYVVYCRNNLKIKIRFQGFDKALMKEMLSYSAYIFVAMIADQLFWRTDQIILAASPFGNSQMIAVYSLAMTFTSVFLSFTNVIGQLQLPRFTRMVVGNESDRAISDRFIKISRIQFFISAFVVSGFALVGREFIVTWVGDAYSDAYHVTLIIMAGLAVGTTQNAGVPVLQAKGLVRYRALILLVTALVKIILTWFFIQLWGVIGAAVATFISRFLGIFVLMGVYYQRKAKLSILGLLGGLIKFVPAVILCLAVSQVIGRYVFSGIPTGFLHVVSVAAVYSVLFAGSVFLLMNGQEKDEIRGLAHNIFDRIRIRRTRT